jgi:hypothetical protein
MYVPASTEVMESKGRRRGIESSAENACTAPA